MKVSTAHFRGPAGGSPYLSPLILHFWKNKNKNESESAKIKVFKTCVLLSKIFWLWSVKLVLEGLKLFVNICSGNPVEAIADPVSERKILGVPMS
jgi:hypothetical protein